MRGKKETQEGYHEKIFRKRIKVLGPGNKIIKNGDTMSTVEQIGNEG